MDPKELQVEEITLGEPRKTKFGTLVPILLGSERPKGAREHPKFLFPARMKLFKNDDWKNSSLMVEIDDIDILYKLQKIKLHILNLYNSTKYLDCKFLKENQLWAKVDKSTRFWKKNEEFKSRFSPDTADNLVGKVVLSLKYLFLGNHTKSISCLVNEALISQIQEPPSLFDEEEEEASEEEW